MITIYSLWKSGSLDLMIKLGIVKTSVIDYCKIYDEYIRIRAKGYNYVQAVEMTAEKLNATDSTVKRAIAQVM